MPARRLGASTTLISAGQTYPAIDEDTGYAVWRKRNFCALWRAPFTAQHSPAPRLSQRPIIAKT